MIIDFTIQNFRSIKAEQTFSLHVEHPKQHLAQHVAYPANDKIGVLRSAGIYGANASGKSNVLWAFLGLQFIACDSGDLKEDAVIPWYEPYRLASDTKNAPTKFEIEFFNHDQVRYLYSISFNKERIVEEILDYYPSRQKANLFTRTEADTWETISFGGRYKGGTKRIPFFKNNSYLSKAGENAGASDLIRSVYKYLKNSLQTLQNLLMAGMFFDPNLFDNPKLISETAKFLSYVDTGISEIKTRINENEDASKLFEGFPKEFRELLKKKTREEFLFLHKAEDGTAEFFAQEIESAGTQKLFNLIPLLMASFAKGRVLILDEIEQNFHPHIAQMIIKLFNDPEINTKNAQLLFTTHNTSLMSPDDLRRDQIWFTEKKDGATQLYSLDHYDKAKVKSDSPFPDWYNDGRFGAVPSIDYAAIANLLRPQPEAKPIEQAKTEMTSGALNA